MSPLAMGPSGGMPGGMPQMPGQMQLGMANNPFGGAGQNGGGIGSWLSDPRNQQLIAGVLAGVGEVIGEERKLGHQRDMLNFEKRMYDDEQARRKRITERIQGLGV